MPIARITLQIARPRQQAMDTEEAPRGNAELPAAAAGQEEADKEVMLRMRVDVLNAEHGHLT